MFFISGIDANLEDWPRVATSTKVKKLSGWHVGGHFVEAFFPIHSCGGLALEDTRQ